ncbi:prolipoprotein diacylglyceryl transferase family protein [Hymenobacter rubidus]|uniref:prolipoprotein diacylglyceryl transferase family protein n=1 Tax=Hymenobacter rubidus TaxID=1441626 RepID=UPI00191D8CEE|nr:prolipoprotein diacylglyceryl transferase family protein [Hymenobacter rubidus]
MTLPDTHGHDFYTPFYLLATLTNVALLLWEGWRRGFPLRPWLTLVAASSLALILGSKLITHPVGEWNALLCSDAPADSARSILGGSLAAVLSVLALRRWLGLPWAVLDALALPLCAALVVQCVGCVLTGCCFGLPTTGAWGLTYAAGTHPWAMQVQAGLLPATAAHSLPVAPTQVLAMLLCAAVAGVLLATRHKRWPVGAWLLLQTGLLLLGRFAQAFWRDPASEPVAGNVFIWLGTRWLGLQLWLLPLGLLAMGVWVWRVGRVDSPALSQPHDAPLVPASRYLLVMVGMLGLTAGLSATALTPPETVAVKGLLLAVLALEAGHLLAAGSTRVVGESTSWSLNFLSSVTLPRLLPVSLAAAVFVLTSQGPAPADSTVAGRLTLSLDAQQSSYTDIVGTSGCGTSTDVTEYEHRARVAGGEARYDLAHAGPGPTVSVGVGAWAGKDELAITQVNRYVPTGLGQLPSTSFPLYAISPFAEVNFAKPHRFGGGLRLGLNMGKLGYRLPTYYDTTLTTLRVGPQFAWWLGWREKVYWQSDLGLGSNCLGHYLARAGIGSGLGRRTGRFVLAGIAMPVGIGTSIGNNQTELPGPMGFVSAQVPLPHTAISFEPSLLSDFKSNYQVNLRVNWQVGGR